MTEGASTDATRAEDIGGLCLDLLATAARTMRERVETDSQQETPAKSVQACALAYEIRAASSIEAIHLLLSSGHEAEALFVVRGLVEDVCSLSYLLTRPERLAKRWWDFGEARVVGYRAKTLEVLGRDSFGSRALVEHDRAAEQTAGTPDTVWWAGIGPARMAREAEEACPGTRAFFELAYPHLCDVAHFNSPGLARYSAPAGEPNGTAAVAPDHLALTTLNALSALAEVVFRLELLMRQPLTDDFLELAAAASALSVEAIRPSNAFESDLRAVAGKYLDEDEE